MAKSGLVGHFVEAGCWFGQQFAAEDQGRHPESVFAAREALRIARSGTPVDLAAVGDALAILAYALSNLGQYHHDAKAAEEALRMSQEQLNERERDTQTWRASGPHAYRNLAWVLNAQGQYLEAETAAKKSLELLDLNQDPLRYARPNANSLLGEALAGQGRFVEAETLLLSAAEQLSEMPEAGANARRESMARVVRMYKAWYAKAPSTVYTAEHDRWFAKLLLFDSKVGYRLPGEV